MDFIINSNIIVNMEWKILWMKHMNPNLDVIEHVRYIAFPSHNARTSRLFSFLLVWNYIISSWYVVTQYS